MTGHPHPRPGPAAPRRGHQTGGHQADRSEHHRGSFLESAQLVAHRSQPLPRAVLGPRARAWLGALRVVVLVLTAMVIYTFIAQLG